MWVALHNIMWVLKRICVFIGWFTIPAILIALGGAILGYWSWQWLWIAIGVQFAQVVLFQLILMSGPVIVPRAKRELGQLNGD